ncbi:MAG: LPS export ABC transporter periplasmic protein LptC [Desulfobacteraceae bacterium]|nr:LPS export ABC transporter periplasmic protein LptC [Desulfobacteraceae bacterium]
MTTPNTTTQKIKQRLILFLILITIGLGGYFLVYKLSSVNPRIKDVDIDSKVARKLNIIETISKKNGITEWKLKATSAMLMKDEKNLILTDVNVTLYTEDKKTIHLTSKKGVLNTKTHDMTLSDNVVATHETYILKTDKLHYKKKGHIIYSKSKVRLEKEKSTIEADTMVTKLNKNKITLKGDVKGKFSEKFDLL